MSDGQIILADGTVATWTSDKTRTSTLTLDADGKRPVSGTIITEVNTQIVTSDGIVIYSSVTNNPLTENIACKQRRGPVGGELETHYRDNSVTVNFGDGTCENRAITVTVNGVTTTKTIGG